MIEEIRLFPILIHDLKINFNHDHHYHFINQFLFNHHHLHYFNHYSHNLLLSYQNQSHHQFPIVIHNYYEYEGWMNHLSHHHNINHHHLNHQHHHILSNQHRFHQCLNYYIKNMLAHLDQNSHPDCNPHHQSCHHLHNLTN